MRWRRENRVVEQILPIAGEFLPGDDIRLDRPPGSVGKHDGIADLGTRCIAEVQRGQIELAQRLHQAESGFLVVGQRMRRNHAPITGRQPDFLGLGDQIADGEHQPVFADDHAAAFAQAAERPGGEGVFGDQTSAERRLTARSAGFSFFHSHASISGRENRGNPQQQRPDAGPTI